MTRSKSSRGRHIPEPGVYEVRVKGKLSDTLVSDLNATRKTDSDTAVIVEVRDQADLHSFMARIEDLGLKVISINPGQAEEGQPSDE